MNIVPSRTRMLQFAVLAFLGVFLVWPLAHVFHRAFLDSRGFTLLYVRALFTDPVQRAAIARSAAIAAMVTLSTLMLALPLSWIVARWSFPGKPLVSALLLLPLIMPPFVGAVGMQMVFARCGALTTLLLRAGVVSGPVDWLGAFPLLGVVLLETLHLFPILYLNLVAALSNVDPSLEEAAANLGASPFAVFRRVTLPLAAPGLFSGLVLVFIWSFTELGTPLVFDVRGVLPVLIYDNVGQIETNPLGYAQVVFLLVVCGLGFWITKRLTGANRHVATLGRLSTTRREQPLTFWPAVAVYALIGAVLILALLPHVSVVLLSVGRRWFLTILPTQLTLDFYVRALTSELTRTALLNSLLLSTAASLLDILLGFAIAWLCVRKRVSGSDLLDALAMLPLAVPGIVIAFGYIGCFAGRFPGSWIDPRLNPMPLLAVSYSIRRLPFMVRAAHAGLEQTSSTYEEAAANLGAGAWRVVRRVTLPLIAANLLAGTILCFAFAMLEVSDSLILAQSEPFYPITKAIFTLMESLENGANVAAALGVWATALLAAALLFAAALMGRKLGQLFRTG